jgi:hypothetical protein
MLGGEAAEAAAEPNHVGFAVQVLEGAMGVVRQGYADQAAMVGVVDADFGLLRQRAERQIRGEQDRHRGRAPPVGGLTAFLET